MPCTPDPTLVPSPWDPLVCLSLDRLVERFAVARDHGDTAAAKQLWGAIALKLDDRLKVFVRSYVVVAATGERLHHDDRDEAFQLARRRVWFNLGETFKGVSVGELHNAARTATGFACADVARARMKREQRTWRSRKATAQEADDELERRSAGHARERHEADGRAAEAKDRVDRAMGRMTNPKHREVLMLERIGLTDEEIAAKLGITPTNVYQRRHRGLVNLKELLTDAPA